MNPLQIDELRYPIGRFSPPSTLSREGRAESIETLRAFPAELRSAVEHLSDEQLETPYRSGGWTVRQLVHHIADSHTNAYVRMRLALTEDWPTVKPYQEALWAELTDAREAAIAPSLDLLTAVHARWVLLLASLHEEDWSSGYVHPESGRQSLEQVLAQYDWHSRHHLAHINGLRSRLHW